MPARNSAAMPASASSGPGYHALISNSSWLNVGVRGGSTSSGTDIIQWWADGCDAANGRQAWMRTFVWFYGGYTLYNAATGLNLDVQGHSCWGGAEIDVWYPNGQVNQIFSTPGGGVLA